MPISPMDEVHLLDSQAPLLARNKYFYRTFDPVSEYNDKEFRERFRMSKQTFGRLHGVVSPLLHQSLDGRGSPTPTHVKLLVALRFYATGSFHYVTGELNGYSPATVCRIVKEVSAAIASLHPQYVTFPTAEQVAEVR